MGLDQAEPLIESAAEADVPSLSALGRRLYAAYFAHLWTEAGFARFVDGHFDEQAMRSEIANAHAAYYLVRIDGETIGFAKTKPREPIPYSSCVGTLLEKLYLLPERTSGGLGQKVLADLIARAAADGANCVWLDVLKTNARARRAYEKAGFVVTGELPFATDLHEIGFFIMRRPLGRAAEPTEGTPAG